MVEIPLQVRDAYKVGPKTHKKDGTESCMLGTPLISRLLKRGHAR